MQHPEFPLFAFISTILVLIPALWHWRAGNVAILSIVFWLSLADFINGVNTIVWAGNVNNPIPVWCDITTKFLVGASYALPLATLCICKHLEMVSSSRKVSYDAKDRRRRATFESIMCFGLPVIFMALHYIVQGHRYDIIENTGCQAAVYISVQAILIIWFPQLLFSVISLIYAALALNNFICRRLTFAAHLQNSNSSLTTNRYLRLIAMALTEMVWTTSLTSYNLWSNVSGGIRPWTNWADVHSNFSRVATFRTVELPPQVINALTLFWWTLPASSLIFFVFLGFGEEALKEYKRFFSWFRTVILRRPAEEKALFGSLPTSRGMKPLHLVNLKTTSSSGSTNLDSPSFDNQAKSPHTLSSHLSKSSATLTISNPGGYYNAHKQTKSMEAKEDPESHYTSEPAPSYYTPSPTYPHTPTQPQPRDIAIPIDPTRIAHSDNAHTQVITIPPSPSDIDTSDTFTLSTFSYYSSHPYPSANPTSPALSLFPPATPITIAPSGLPPPPRHGPRHAGSKGSINSAMSVVPNVPEDVGSASYERRRVLGISGGGIFVTVHQEADSQM